MMLLFSAATLAAAGLPSAALHGWQEALQELRAAVGPAAAEAKVRIFAAQSRVAWVAAVAPMGRSVEKFPRG